MPGEKCLNWQPQRGTWTVSLGGGLEAPRRSYGLARAPLYRKRSIWRAERRREASQPAARLPVLGSEDPPRRIAGGGRLSVGRAELPLAGEPSEAREGAA